MGDTAGQRGAQQDRGPLADIYAISAVSLFDWDRRLKYGHALDLLPVVMSFNVYHIVPIPLLEINHLLDNVRELLNAAGVPSGPGFSFRVMIHIHAMPLRALTLEELIAKRDLSNMNLFVYCDSAHTLTLPEEYAEVNKDPSILCVDFDWPTPNSAKWRKFRAMIAVRVLQLLDRERNSFEQ